MELRASSLHKPVNATTRDTRFNFVSFSESMLCLTVPTGRLLEDTRSLDLEFKGVESNVSIALARLGWCTR